MATSKSSPRNLVVLLAFDNDGRQVQAARLSIDDYYEESSELIDSSEYRAGKGIRCIRGKIYGPKGRVSQSFENHYNRRGGLVRSRSVHDDGTVTEQVVER